jgi:hypothetical protein
MHRVRARVSGCIGKLLNIFGGAFVVEIVSHILGEISSYSSCIHEIAVRCNFGYGRTRIQGLEMFASQVGKDNRIWLPLKHRWRKTGLFRIVAILRTVILVIFFIGWVSENRKETVNIIPRSTTSSCSLPFIW